MTDEQHVFDDDSVNLADHEAAIAEWGERLRACTARGEQVEARAAQLREALETAKVLLRDELTAHGAYNYGALYCWWCYEDTNGHTVDDPQPHKDNCWRMRAEAVLRDSERPTI